MKNLIKKLPINDKRIRTLRTASLQLLIFVFALATANADPIDETYRDNFYIMTLGGFTADYTNSNSIFDYRSRMLNLTGGVMPTNVKVGFSIGVAFMRATQKEYYDYIYNVNYIDNHINIAVVSDTPYGAHINGTPWSDDPDQSVDNALNFLENYNVGENLQVDRWGRIRNASRPQNPTAENEQPDNREMQLSLSRNNNMVQEYLRRNNIMAARVLNWYREQHPDLVIFSSMSSEYQQNLNANNEFCDYNPITKQEFRDWLSGSGLYVGEGQYSDLATFNSAFSGASDFPWPSWSAVQPPTSENWSTVSADGRWWNKWHEFRVAQLRNIVQAQINWTREAGWSPDLIYGHQTPFNPASTDAGVRRHAGYWTTAFVEEGGNGITTYNTDASDLTLFGTIYNNDKNWGSFEYNRLLTGVANNLNALNNFWDGKGHIVCPGFWDGADTDPHKIKDRDFETALQQFVANKFADSFTHIKSYEAAPTAKDVIWAMSDSGDVENSANISSMEFTNGVMSASVNGAAPNVSLELDESKHYLKSDNYYAASFRISVSNSAGNTGKFLWHENGGGNNEIEFSLKNGWNVYKINLMESSSWRDKNIDDLKFYFGATNSSEVKLDWFRLEADHCWHFDDSGEIYGQNQLSGGAFSNSGFSATTTSGDSFFYFSTDKQGGNADRAFIDAKFYKIVRVKMTSSANGTGEIHWWLRDGTHGAKTFAVQSGTQTYEIDMTDEPNWTNSVTVFRIDPVNQTGADFSIEYVNVSPKMIPPRIANSDLTVNSPLPVFLYDAPVEAEYSGVTYSMELATDFGFTNIVYSAENLIGGTNIYNGNSLLDGLYWWRIRAKANDGTFSPWAVPMAIYIRIWNFGREEDIYYANDFTTPVITNGIWSAANNGVDPYVRFNAGYDKGVNTELYPRFCYRMKADNEPSLIGSYFFFHCGDGYKNELYSFPHNGEWQYKDIDLSSNADWKGYAWYIRISPVLYSGNTSSVSAAYFLPADAHNVEVVDTTAPGGQITVPYSHSFSATGAIEKVKWLIASGNIPVGLSLDTDGTLAGTPTVAGFSTFTITAEDEVFRSGSKQFTVEIVPESGLVFSILCSVFGIFFAKRKLYGVQE